MQRIDMATAVRNYLDELGTGKVTGTVVCRAIDRSCRKLNRLVKMNKVDATLGLRTGAREMTLATAMMDVYRVRLGTGTDRKRLDPTTEAALDRQYGDWESATAGTPTHYYTDGMKMGFYPKPKIRSGWTASAGYDVDDIVVPTATDNGFWYKCTVAGTVGTSAPTWPTTLTGTVSDGDVTWQQSGHTRVYMKCLQSPSSLAYATSAPTWLPATWHDTIPKDAAIDLAGGFLATTEGMQVRQSSLYQEYLEEVNDLRKLNLRRSKEYSPQIRPKGYDGFRRL